MDESDSDLSNAIAIVGMAGRFPGAGSITELWENLCNGTESIRPFTPDELTASGVTEEILKNPDYVNAGAPLEAADCFDAGFFGYLPREAELMDPQHRIFLECAWSALEDAGYDPAQYDGDIGVFGGVARNTYFLKNAATYSNLMASGATYDATLGSDKDYTATRVAYQLNLNGPAMSIQTACSSSGVAVHVASQALLNGECDMALAGGARVQVPLTAGYQWVEGGIPSPDGHCRPFDKDANGTVYGSGVAIVILKRLEDALDDRDHIYSVILGSAINNDGADKVGFTAPSIRGQTAVIESALGMADVSAESIGYVEAHGTGTSLGDPIEVAALTSAYRRQTDRKGYCAIGSLKSNIGHLDAGAGVAGLIKTSLMLYHKKLVPSLNFQEPNPQLDLENSPFFVSTSTQDWQADSVPRRAALSAFGLGGTNFHIVLEEAPEKRAPRAASTTWRPLFQSAKSPEGLNTIGDNLASALDDVSDIDLDDVSYTLAVGRSALPYRRVTVANAVDEAVSCLRSQRASNTVSGMAGSPPDSIAFLFSGQGAQYPGMGRDLYEEEPVFRDVVDQCCAVIERQLDVDLKEVVFGNPHEQGKKHDLLNKTRYTQPGLFVLEYALAKLWMSKGIVPDAVAGHSIGELVAACIAGVFDLDTALKIIIERGKLMQSMKPGDMLAINLAEEDVRGKLPENIEIASINTPTLCVVSGTSRDINKLQKELEDGSIQSTVLNTSHAFHSKMMEPTLKPFQKFISSTKLRPPQIPIASNVTGDWMTEEQAIDPAYWSSQIRSAVRMSDCIGKLLEEPSRAVIELGPGNTLCSFVRRHPSYTKDHAVVQSVRHPTSENNDAAYFYLALAQLWCAGYPLDWKHLYPRDDYQRVSLPTYPFERKRFWLDSPILPDIVKDQSTEPSADVSIGAGSEQQQVVQAESVSRQELVESELCNILQELSGIPKADLNVDSSFIELGFDSLFLTRANTEFKKVSGVDIGFRQLFDEAPTIAALAQFIDDQLPEDSDKFVPASSTEPAMIEKVSENHPNAAEVAANLQSSMTSIAANGNDYKQVFARQLDIIQEQLGLIRSLQDSRSPATRLSIPPRGENAVASYSTPFASETLDEPKEAKPVGPWKPIATGDYGQLSPTQQAHLSSLIERLVSKTGKSKEYTQAHRAHLADPRTVAGFRRIWKELVYPVVVERSQGATVWDLDGNEYTDVAMGFGVSFLGHNPEYVIDAVRDQLSKGVEIGPQHPLAGEVAKLVCDFTGMERAAFCNTGSEAVLAAIRMARTVTGKNRIAVFAGDYHGIFDEVLAKRVDGNNESRSMPVAPGIPDWSVEPTLVLEHGDTRSFETIRAYADEIAAVIVEPVQSRHPDLQPIDYLLELRAITKELDIPLVLDEIITGFRCHPGGIQALWGIEADIATYGKSIGGGFPIAVVAGSRKFMDVLDGGHWNYGDDSFPETGVTWFAGTFVRHPVALAAAKAALEHMKDAGAELQNVVNVKTQEMVSELNEFLQTESVPIHIETFSSLFHIKFLEHQEVSSLLFAHLRDNGIHLTEGRVSFLSTAHTKAQIDHFKDAFKTSVSALRQGGFLPVHRLPIKDEPLDSELWVGVGTKLEEQISDLQQWEANLRNELDIVTLDSYPGLHDQLNALCSALAWEYLQSSGLDLNTGSECSIQVLKSQLGVQADFDRFILAMLLMLQEDGLIELDQEQIRVLSSAGSMELSSHLASEIRSKYPQFSGLVDMLQHCSANYPDALSGEIHSISVLLPDGRRDFVKQKLSKETAEYRQLRVYEKLAAQFVVSLAEQRPIRILEVGAGGGDLTWQIVDRIRGLGSLYHYSDIAPVFVADAKQKVSEDDLDFVRCDALDISKDPSEQDFAPDSYDVVLGLNVVHATPDVTVSMNNMKSLLAPGGILCLVELVQPTRWEHLIWGLAKGWWLFDDEYRQDQPLLPVDEWRKAVEPLGLEDFQVFPSDADRHEYSDSALLVAQKPPAMLAGLSESEPLTPQRKQVPLLEGQSEIWLAATLSDDANRAFNLTNVLQFDGFLDVETLKTAIQELVNRHEALRTSINEDGSSQSISSHVDIEIQMHDLSNSAGSSQQQELNNILEGASATAFNLSKAPLFRPQIVRLAATEYVLLLTVHHIICDGWSTGVLMRELGAIYRQRQGRSVDLSQSPNQLSDFVAMTLSEDFSQKLSKSKQYWLSTLVGDLPLLTIPSDRERPPTRTFSSARVEHELPRALVDDIKKLGQKVGCTLFHTLLASYAAYLHQLSTQADIIIGVSAAQQPTIGMPDVVSHCVSMLPLRFEIDPEGDFKTFMQDVRRILLDAFDHQECTYGQLLPELNIARSAGQPPLINTVFNLDPSMLDIDFGDLEVRTSSAPRNFEIFDIFFNVVDTGKGARIECTFNCDLFDNETIADRLAGFENMLRGVCGSNESKIGRLSICSDTDLELIARSNDTMVDYGLSHTIPELIANTASFTESKIIESLSGKELSMPEFDRITNQVANFLRENGAGADVLVGLCMERSIDLYMGLIGILKAGSAYVPMDPDYPAERLRFMIEDANAPLLLTQERLLDRFPKTKAKSICLDSDSTQILKFPDHAPAVEIDPDSLAYVIYTSGSTGQPKGAMNSHRAICNRLAWVQERFGYSAKDTLLQKTPFGFDVSAWELYPPLMSGANLVIPKPGGHQDPDLLAGLIQKHGVTVAHFVPSMLQIFLDQHDLNQSCRSIRAVICSGEALSVDLQNRFHVELEAELHNLYGPTEAAVEVTHWPCKRDGNPEIIPIGWPVPNTQIHILDRYLQPVPVGVDGELYIGGVQVGRGYHNRSRLTENCFIKDPFTETPGARLYKSGDLARWRRDGAIEYRGRIDHQIKVRGLRIELGEIESALEANDNIRQAAVIVRELSRDDHRLIAYYVSESSSELVDSELRESVSSILPRYMVPQHFVHIEKMPTTPNGKLDRVQLTEFSTTLEEAGMPPATRTEKCLAEHWRRLLKVSEVFKDSDFFALGGHSILAIKLINTIRNETSCAVPLATIFDHSRFADFCLELDRMGFDSAASPKRETLRL